MKQFERTPHFHDPTKCVSSRDQGAAAWEVVWINIRVSSI